MLKHLCLCKMVSCPSARKGIFLAASAKCSKKVKKIKGPPTYTMYVASKKATL